MAGNVKAVPEGMHTITPHLVVRKAIEAIDFYRKALGAEIRGVHKTPDGRVMHAELMIGNSILFLSDEFPGMGSCASPQTLNGTSITLNVYTNNVDQLFKQAESAGAAVIMPLQNMFWGDRYGQLKDPYGHTWALAQHLEDVPRDELERRGREAFEHMCQDKGKS